MSAPGPEPASGGGGPDVPAEARPLPTPVRRLRLVLIGQAVAYGAAALVGVIAYYARGAEHLGLGGYAAARTQPVILVLLGGVAAGLLVWVARRVISRPALLGPWIRVIEMALVADAGLGVLFGLFSVWLIASLLLAVVVLWALGTEETSNYLF